MNPRIATPWILSALVIAGIGACSRQTPMEPLHQVAIDLQSPPKQTIETQRPLADFIGTQGSTNIFIPPIPDFVGWSSAAAKPPVRFASVDYAGLAGKWLATNGGPNVGTQISGTISERPLADGRAEVSVNLHVKNAMTWVLVNPNDVAHDPTIFGHRANEILANRSLAPALSDAEMLVTFKNTAPGAPLPDLVTAFILGQGAPGQELVKLMFRSSGFGLLTDGTPAKCTVTQTGLFMTGFHGATADAFPCEKVDLSVVGRRAGN
jgi:hypothetical protein